MKMTQARSGSQSFLAIGEGRRRRRVGRRKVYNFHPDDYDDWIQDGTDARTDGQG